MVFQNKASIQLRVKGQLVKEFKETTSHYKRCKQTQRYE